MLPIDYYVLSTCFIYTVIYIYVDPIIYCILNIIVLLYCIEYGSIKAKFILRQSLDFGACRS